MRYAYVCLWKTIQYKNYCVCWDRGAMSTMSIIYTVCAEPLFLIYYYYYFFAPCSM